MTLKRTIAKLEDVDEALRGFYKKAESGGGFVLDAEADPDAERLPEFRENNRKMHEQLEAWKKLGVTAEQAKDLIAAARKKKDDEEDANKSAAELKTKYEKQLAEAKTAHAEELRKLQEKVDGYEVVTPLRQALTGAGIIGAELEDFLELPSVKRRYRKGEDGKLEFMDANGDVQLGVTAEKFAETMRKERPRFFEAVKPGGSGQRTSDPPKGEKPERTVSIDDQDGLNSNIEEIAAGKVGVVAGTEA